MKTEYVFYKTLGHNKTSYNLYNPPLGSGASSTVYRSINVATGEVMASKMINIQDYDASLIDKEAKLLYKLSHPNILKFCKCIRTLSNAYLFTELCNITLSDYKPAYSNPIILRKVLKDVLNGLAYLHDNHIMHRDIKPENIYINVDPKDNSFIIAKIGDFGISKNVDMTMSDVGTYLYKAPEVLIHAGYTNLIDMWSVGVIVYRLMCGGFPARLPNNTYDHDLYIDKMLKVSPYIIELILSTIRIDPSKRLSAKQALSLPLFTVPDSALIDENIYKEYEKKQILLHPYKLKFDISK
jgi:calcium-dependent protein kinase